MGYKFGFQVFTIQSCLIALRYKNAGGMRNKFGTQCVVIVIVHDLTRFSFGSSFFIVLKLLDSARCENCPYNHNCV